MGDACGAALKAFGSELFREVQSAAVGASVMSQHVWCVFQVLKEYQMQVQTTIATPGRRMTVTGNMHTHNNTMR